MNGTMRLFFWKTVKYGFRILARNAKNCSYIDISTFMYISYDFTPGLDDLDKSGLP